MRGVSVFRIAQLCPADEAGYLPITIKRESRVTQQLAKRHEAGFLQDEAWWARESSEVSTLLLG